jgi:hypothetical protein
VDERICVFFIPNNLLILIFVFEVVFRQVMYVCVCARVFVCVGELCLYSTEAKLRILYYTGKQCGIQKDCFFERF